MSDESSSRSSDEPHNSDIDARFSYANERTFLAWIRTALGLMTAGLAITQVFPPFKYSGGRRIIGLPLIALGVVIAGLSIRTWRANEEAMRLGRRLPKSVLPLVTAIVVAAVAVTGFVLVIAEGGK